MSERLRRLFPITTSNVPFQCAMKIRKGREEILVMSGRHPKIRSYGLGKEIVSCADPVDLIMHTTTHE